MKTTVAQSILILTLGLTACQGSPATLELVPSARPEATVSSTSRLTTAVGELAIVAARFVEEANGARPQPGEKLLLVILAQPDLKPLDPSQFSLEAFDQAVHDTSQGGVYVLGSDGSQTISTMGGWVEDEFALGFRVPAAAETYSLFWPGNDPIAIVPAD